VTEPCPGYAPEPRRVTQRELYGLVGKCQAAMKKAGVEKGHRVAYWGGNRLVSGHSGQKEHSLQVRNRLLSFLPLREWLASTPRVGNCTDGSSIGAIFSSAAADFGVDGVIERLQQVRLTLVLPGGLC
jgi:acetoacetyl-CoA synthetase